MEKDGVTKAVLLLKGKTKNLRHFNMLNIHPIIILKTSTNHLDKTFFTLFLPFTPSQKHLDLPCGNDYREVCLVYQGSTNNSA